MDRDVNIVNSFNSLHLDYTVDNCSKETPRAVVKILNELGDAVKDNILYAEEENTYKKIISDRIMQFEKKCGCNK